MISINWNTLLQIFFAITLTLIGPLVLLYVKRS